MRLPEFVTELSPIRETLAALEQGESALAGAAAEKNAQVCVSSADQALALWERDYGLPVREGAAPEDRRAAVLEAMAGGRTLTPAFLEELCVTLGGADRGRVEEDFAPQESSEDSTDSSGSVPASSAPSESSTDGSSASDTDAITFPINPSRPEESSEPASSDASSDTGESSATSDSSAVSDASGESL